MTAEPSPQERVRVILADDDVLLREGLASLLERTGFDVVGQAGDADRTARRWCASTSRTS